MQVHEAESAYYSKLENYSKLERLNSITDATAIMSMMEDEAVRVAALANYIVRNLSTVKGIILETHTDDLLEYGLLSSSEGSTSSSRSRYTLREFIGNKTYTELVVKVVQLNGWDNYENPHINIILLDKIYRHESVLEYLVKV